MLIRLGTRGSALARWQAQWVAEQLRARGVAVQEVIIVTSGDRRDGPIGGGTRGAFTKEIQQALLQRRIDLAVHSLKDLPTEPVEGLLLAAIPQRGPHADVLVCNGDATVDTLPPGAKLGTGSVRRRAQLLYLRADLHVEPIRGNVDTRLRKLEEGQFQALVLAEAGLQRLDLARRITQRLPMEIMLPAVGQGALALETRADDRDTQQAVAPLDDPDTRAAVCAERAMLAALRGGCLAPVAGWGRVDSGKLVLTGRVLSPDGSRRIDVTESADPQQAETLGRRVAEVLLARGAGQMIAAARQ